MRLHVNHVWCSPKAIYCDYSNDSFKDYFKIIDNSEFPYSFVDGSSNGS